MRLYCKDRVRAERGKETHYQEPLAFVSGKKRQDAIDVDVVLIFPCTCEEVGAGAMQKRSRAKSSVSQALSCVCLASVDITTYTFHKSLAGSSS